MCSNGKISALDAKDGGSTPPIPTTNYNAALVLLVTRILGKDENRVRFSGAAPITNTGPKH